MSRRFDSLPEAAQLALKAVHGFPANTIDLMIDGYSEVLEKAKHPHYVIQSLLNPRLVKVNYGPQPGCEFTPGTNVEIYQFLTVLPTGVPLTYVQLEQVLRSLAIFIAIHGSSEERCHIEQSKEFEKFFDRVKATIEEIEAQ